MTFAFRQPISTGKSITCTSIYDTVVERVDRYEVTAEVVCENTAGEAMLSAMTDGITTRFSVGAAVPAVSARERASRATRGVQMAVPGGTDSKRPDSYSHVTRSNEYG